MQPQQKKREKKSGFPCQQEPTVNSNAAIMQPFLPPKFPPTNSIKQHINKTKQHTGHDMPVLWPGKCLCQRYPPQKKKNPTTFTFPTTLLLLQGEGGVINRNQCGKTCGMDLKCLEEGRKVKKTKIPHHEKNGSLLPLHFFFFFLHVFAS